MANTRTSRIEKGQGLVEFALVLLVFLIMAITLFEVGRAIFIYQSVITASQEAARWGSCAEDDDGDDEPCYMECDTIRDLAIQRAYFADVVASDVEISWDEGSEGSPVVEDCDTIAETDIENGYRIVVTVTGHYDPVAPIPLIDFPPIDFEVTSRRTIIKELQLQGG
jgi:Flp pilus assembly protein TadG